LNIYEENKKKVIRETGTFRIFKGKTNKRNLIPLVKQEKCWETIGLGENGSNELKVVFPFFLFETQPRGNKGKIN
jgi:hypothetical protein